MGTITVDDQDDRVNRMIRGSDISFTSAPLTHTEDVDVLGLTETQLLAYVCSLQDEARALRHLVHEALRTVSKLTDDLKRSARVVEFQRQQLQRQRERLAA